MGQVIKLGAQGKKELAVAFTLDEFHCYLCHGFYVVKL